MTILDYIVIGALIGAMLFAVSRSLARGTFEL
jgi:hypothetical protein